MFNVRCFLLSFLFASLSPTSVRAEQFGEIGATSDAMYSGSTFHGYSETRVTLENRSPRSHVVTLVFPNNAYGSYGNSINHLTRAVKLAPGTHVVVPLLQPPLPAGGDGTIRVEVDGRNEGILRAPNGNNHCNYYGRENESAVVLVARNLDYDAVNHVLNAGHGGFTATMATGAPDASGRGGYDPQTWMADQRHYNQTNWLELDYATPQIADRVVVHSLWRSLTPPGSIELIGESGSNLVVSPFTSAISKSTSSGYTTEFIFAPTAGPVKMVRLNLGRGAGSSIAIDAVEIANGSTNQWASDARASSDNSSMSGAYSSSRSGEDLVTSMRAEMPAPQWSETWLAYSPLDAITIGANDFDAMPAPVLNALQDYVQAGGLLFLFGKNELPAGWHPSQRTTLHDGARFELGFGQCFVFPSENISALDARSIQTLREAVHEAAHYWRSLPGDGGSANTALPVVENLKIPTRGIVIIMLIFIVMIGPANIIILNRHNRRTWMLWTIPAISFFTTALVFSYSLLREGITPNTRITGLTVLDQASHRAATTGGTAFYCPLTPSGGLHFDFDTEATPLVHVGWDRGGTSRDVDWTLTQQFRRGWVSARVPAHFHLRRPETRRERVQLVNENGQLAVINGLGVTVKSLWLADATGKIYHTANVPGGQKAALMASEHARVITGPQTGPAALLRDLTYTAGKNPLTEDDATRFLLPDTYIAELDGNPFIENALGAAASAKRTRTTGVVFGVLEPESR